jgi:hypothetical protein
VWRAQAWALCLWQVLFRYALALLKLHEAALLQLDDVVLLHGFFRVDIQDVRDVDQLSRVRPGRLHCVPIVPHLAFFRAPRWVRAGGL